MAASVAVPLDRLAVISGELVVAVKDTVPANVVDARVTVTACDPPWLKETDVEEGVIVYAGAVTVKVCVPLDAANPEPVAGTKLAVTVSLPTVKPFAVVGATPLKVALPPVKATEPTVTPATLKVTVPAKVPPLGVTVAVKLSVAEELPRRMDDGLAVTAVVVAMAAATVSVPEVDEAANVPSPPYAIATVCVPAVLNDVTVEAVPPLSVIAFPTTPSIVNVTVPPGVEVTVELPDATVAVSVTL